VILPDLADDVEAPQLETIMGDGASVATVIPAALE
jgi:hypothetical protein